MIAIKSSSKFRILPAVLAWRLGYLLLALFYSWHWWSPVAWGEGIGGQGPAREPRKEMEAKAGAERVAVLKARIAELEEALRKAAARSSELSHKPQPVRTQEAEDLARRFKPGTTDEDTIQRLAAFIDNRDGFGLNKEIEKRLLAGEDGFAVLYDFLRYLDKEPRRGNLASTHYQTLFGLMHLAMLHDLEVARFSHFYLMATWNEALSSTRLKLYDYIPSFLEFHAGRFPDLEGAFQRDIAEKLSQGRGDMQRLFEAMRSLKFFPPLENLRPMLSAAATLQQVNLAVEHLAQRDDLDALRNLMRFIRERGDFQSPAVKSALAALARMSIPEAENALKSFMAMRKRPSFEPAIWAYFSVPRDPETARFAMGYLNSEAELKSKEAFLTRLRAKNLEVYRLLEAHLAEIESVEVKNFFIKSK